MKPTTKTAIAGLLSAAGAVLTAFAAEFGGAMPPDAPAEPATPADPPKPAKAKKEKPAPAPATEPEPEQPASEPAGESEEAPTGKSYEELKALIEPLVKEGRGEEVKKLIKKYDPESTPPSIKTMPAKNHAAFEKDLATLSY
jgi:hypothetical protein